MRGMLRLGLNICKSRIDIPTKTLRSTAMQALHKNARPTASKHACIYLHAVDVIGVRRLYFLNSRVTPTFTTAFSL